MWYIHDKLQLKNIVVKTNQIQVGMKKKECSWETMEMHKVVMLYIRTWTTQQVKSSKIQNKASFNSCDNLHRSLGIGLTLGRYDLWLHVHEKINWRWEKIAEISALETELSRGGRYQVVRGKNILKSRRGQYTVSFPTGHHVDVL